jgi:glycosyltransferase involved in cell wall biosynthesis
VGFRVAHLSFSSSGGAGSVATRLASAQRERGHDSFVLSRISGSLRDAPWSAPLHTLAAVIDDRIIRHPQFDAPISLLRDGLGKSLERELESADIIHIHWPNGLIDLHSLGRVAGNRPVVWTMHDMNAFTAVSHYSLEESTTSPAVRALFAEAANRHLASKKKAIEAIGNLHLVSPSQWLASRARDSSVFDGKPVHIIRNPLPEQTGPQIDMADARAQLGLPDSAVVFMTSASSLNDAIKAIPTAVRAFEKAFAGRDDVFLLVAGRGSLETHSAQVRTLGFLTATENSRALSASNYFVVPSRAENQPLAIAEAQAHGASLIARDATGLPEHLEIDPRGLLFGDHTSLGGVLINAAAKCPTARMRSTLATKARARYDMSHVVDQYEQVYTEALS